MIRVNCNWKFNCMTKSVTCLPLLQGSNFAYMRHNEIICYCFVYKFSLHEVIISWHTLLMYKKLLRFAAFGILHPNFHRWMSWLNSDKILNCCAALLRTSHASVPMSNIATVPPMSLVDMMHWCLHVGISDCQCESNCAFHYRFVGFDYSSVLSQQSSVAVVSASNFHCLFV